MKREFTHRDAEDLEVLAGRRHPAGRRAVRYDELNDLIARSPASGGASTGDATTVSVPGFPSGVTLDYALNSVNQFITETQTNLTNFIDGYTGTAADLNSNITTVSANLASANASITTAQAAIATIESYQAASYTLRVRAGGAVAGLEIVAADDPINGPQSGIKLIGDTIVDGSLSADAIGAGSMSTSYLNVDTSLVIDSVNGSFQFGKTAVADFANDGIFLGRIDSGGTLGFGFNIGRRSGGKEEYIRIADGEGLTIKNATFKIGTGIPTATEFATVQTATQHNIAGATETITLIIQAPGGGAGSSGFSGPEGSGIDGANGVNAADMTITLRDGATTITSWTATGGRAGRGADYQADGSPAAPTGGHIAYGQNSPYAGAGDGGSPVTTFTGSGTGASVVPGQAGYAGQLITVSGIDVSGLAAPNILVTITAGGAGGAGPYFFFNPDEGPDVDATMHDGQAGQTGYVRVTEIAQGSVDAGPIANASAAHGSVSFVTSTAGSLDFSAPGLWTFTNVAAGTVFSYSSDGSKTLTVTNRGTVTFIADKDEVSWSGSTETTTSGYYFWPMQ